MNKDTPVTYPCSGSYAKKFAANENLLDNVLAAIALALPTATSTTAHTIPNPSPVKATSARCLMKRHAMLSTSIPRALALLLHHVNALQPFLDVLTASPQSHSASLYVLTSFQMIVESEERTSFACLVVLPMLRLGGTLLFCI